MKPLYFPKINLGKLSHDQLLMEASRIVNEWEKRGTIPLVIQLLLQEIIRCLDILRKVLAREKSCELTKKIHELDALRDRAYMLLVRKVRNSQDEFEQSVVDAGATLLPIIEKYPRDIVNLSFTEETSQMLFAIKEFLSPGNEDCLETLNALTDLERVVTFNNDFEKVWNERNTLGSNDEELPLMREIRKTLERRLRLLLKNTEFLYNQGHDSVDATLFTVIDKELTKAGATIKTRDTLEENEEISNS